MKKNSLYLVLGAALLAPLFVSCQSKMPEVPVSNRKVVEPDGSSSNAKPWNQTTRKEGEAVLGPLSNMHR